MDEERKYYVYMYLREDGTPYYVGKGTGDRAYVKGKRRIKPPKNLSRITFHAQNLTEEEAFAIEIELIQKYGRVDNDTGILRNLTDGGEGGSGRIFSEEVEVKRIAAMNTPEARAKMSASLKKSHNTPEMKAKFSSAAKEREAKKRAEKLASQANLQSFLEEPSTQLDTIAEKQQS